MNRLKLEIIKLANEDVIATSCNSVFGVAYYQQTNHPGQSDEWGAEGYQNGTNLNNYLEQGRCIYVASYTKPKGFNGEGYYHVKSDGSIIEKCPYGESAYEHHNVNFD